MLDYVVQLTKDATQIGPQDHDTLRGEGFDDRTILQITLIASWFNYINRVADALGVGRKDIVDAPPGKTHERNGSNRRDGGPGLRLTHDCHSPKLPARLIR